MLPLLLPTLLLLLPALLLLLPTPLLLLPTLLLLLPTLFLLLPALLLLLPMLLLLLPALLLLLLVLVGHYFVWHIRVLSDVVICRAWLSSKAPAWAYKHLEPGPGQWLRLSLAGLRLKPRLQSEREMHP